jgi:lipopolysaccharide transport system permease protein
VCLSKDVFARFLIRTEKAGAMEGFLANRFVYLQQIWKLRYFWFSLVQNDLNTRYRRSFLGIGWSLLRPLAMTTILCVVFGKLFNLDPRDYAPYLLVGMTTWQFITESLNQGCYSFSQGSAYIRQQQLPLAIFPLRTVLGASFHSLLAFGIALVVTWVFRGTLNPIALLNLIPGFLLLFLLGWFMAILSGIFFTHFPDTNHLLEILLQMLFYVTPILYRPENIENRGRFQLAFRCNPFTSILGLIRAPILEGTAPELEHIVVSLAFVSVVGVVAILALRKLEKNLIFWI